MGSFGFVRRCFRDRCDYEKLLVKMRFRHSMISDLGGRETNQDFAGFVEAGTGSCWVVADGLGGHRGGEIASEKATEAIIRSFQGTPSVSPEALEHHINAAQDAVLRCMETAPEYATMRTTVAVLLVDSEGAMVGHVGDSRLYHFSQGRIAFQTLDHSVPQAMAAAGDIAPEEIRFHEDRNRLLRTLGKAEKLRPDILKTKRSVVPGDVFLLCTDGFWEHVTEAEMEAELAASESPEQWLEKMTYHLMGRAEGEFDNYTAIGIFCDAAHTKVPASKKRGRLRLALLLAVLVLLGFIGYALLDSGECPADNLPAAKQQSPRRGIAPLTTPRRSHAESPRRHRKIANHPPAAAARPRIDSSSDDSDHIVEAPPNSTKKPSPKPKRRQRRTAR